jgi:hypothetical protein
MKVFRLLSFSLFILSTAFLQCQTNNSIYDTFEISKGALGKIKIGQSISDAELYLKEFKMKKDSAWLFGYGGGGPIHLFYDTEKPILGLIPKRDTDTIHAIIVISEKFTNNKELSTALTFDELKQIFPSTEIKLNEKHNWEQCLIEEYNMLIVFATNDDTRIAEYDFDENYIQKINKLKNVSQKIDWIVIE